MREFDRRPWGTYTVLEEDRTFKVKRIEVLPGKRLSYQKHSQRSEHWFVVAGVQVQEARFVHPLVNVAA